MRGGTDEGQRLGAGKKRTLVGEFQLFEQSLATRAGGKVPAGDDDQADRQARANENLVLAELARANYPEEQGSRAQQRHDQPEGGTSADAAEAGEHRCNVL